MRNALLGAMLLAASASPVLAQTGTHPSVTTPTTSMATPGEGPHFVSVPNSGMLSSNIVGLSVTNDANQTVGTIKDVALASDKSVEGYVVSISGMLGVGEHYVVVSPASVKVSYDATGKKWVAKMDATADQLKAAPQFTYEGKWKS
jgi:methionine-rich copper-binding protein CopC